MVMCTCPYPWGQSASLQDWIPSTSLAMTYGTTEAYARVMPMEEDREDRRRWRPTISYRCAIVSICHLANESCIRLDFHFGI